MNKDYANKNLQKASFKNEDLVNSNFSGSDLRGADFTGSNLTDANLTHVKTGIPLVNTIFIFLAALVVSLASGYIAMLAGHTIQGMLKSADGNVRTAGIISIVLIVLFLAYCFWKGGGAAIRNLFIPAIAVSIVIGLVAYFSGLGTGMGMLFLAISLVLIVFMLIVGTIARAAAGVLSSTILFMIVALGGGMFGKSVGGGIGTVVLAISCVVISKRALGGARGFESLRKIACAITSKFGTSFRNARLSNANFSQSKIQNADFSNADVSSVKWGDSKKVNCIIN